MVETSREFYYIFLLLLVYNRTHITSTIFKLVYLYKAFKYINAYNRLIKAKANQEDFLITAIIPQFHVNEIKRITKSNLISLNK